MSELNDIKQLLRPNIADLTPYQSARRIGGDGEVWLNANEYPISPKLTLTSQAFNRYPDPQPMSVIQGYANYANVQPEQVIVSRGADEAIELLMRAFCEPNKDSIIYCPPTYGMYLVSAQTLGIKYKAIPQTADWQLDLDTIQKNIETVKLIYICSPNNPTGNLLNPDDIKTLLTLTKNRALVIVDEAYIEFSMQNSVVSWLTHYPNLVILRTLSKAFALAGLRCGFALANKPVIDALKKVIAPYPLPSPVADIAAQALSKENLAATQLQVLNVNQQKEALIAALRKIDLIETIYPSEANYILIKCKNSQIVFNHLWNNGIIVRDQSKQQGLEGCIRITIGLQSECNLLISSLQILNHQEH